jgi:hypothetical protein
MPTKQNNGRTMDRQGRGFSHSFHHKPRRDVTVTLVSLTSVYVILIIIGLTLLAEAAPV